MHCNTMRLLFIYLLISWYGVAVAAPQTWTDKRGRKLVAEFVSSADGKVVLRNTQGRELTFELKALNDESQERARQLSAPPESDSDFGKLGAAPAKTIAAAPAPRANKRGRRSRGAELKIFGLNGVTFRIFENGTGTFTMPSEGGRPVAPPLNVAMGVRYKDTKTKSKVFETHLTPPKVTDTGVEFHMQYSHQAIVRVAYEVKNDKLSAWYSLVEADAIPYPAHLAQLRIESPELAEWRLEMDAFVGPQYPDGISLDGLRRAIGKKYLRLTTAAGTTNLAFTEKVEADKRREAETMVVADGNVYGPRSMVVRGPSKLAILQVGIYKGMSPMDGYSVAWINNEFGRGNPSSAMTVEFK
jgi:hypothetical protein